VATLGSWYLVELPALGLKRRFGVDRPGAVTTATGWEPITPDVAPPPPPRPLSRTTIAVLGVAGLVLAGGILRFTAFVGDPESVAMLPQPDGLAFPTGDLDRSGYWSLVGLEPTLEDTFDRSDADDLGTADSGQPWEVTAGSWAIRNDGAVATGDPAAGPQLAVVPQVVNDGLVEVGLRVAATGAGLVFRYEDPRNYWAVTADTTTITWTVTQVIDGEATTAGQFSAPVFDGVTISVTQNVATVRFLVEGIEYYRVLDPTPDEVLRTGLVADGPLAVGAIWDRFLVMADEATLELVE
jgi:hypothetical protein